MARAELSQSWRWPLRTRGLSLPLEQGSERLAMGGAGIRTQGPPHPTLSPSPPLASQFPPGMSVPGWGGTLVSAFLHERQIQSAFGRTASSLFSLSHPLGTLDCSLHFLVIPQTFNTDLPSGTDLRLYLALRLFFFFFVYLLICSWHLSGLILGAGVTAYKRALSQAI